MSTTPLRDLGDDAFGERYGCDRFTATVLTNRFGYIVEHMCVRLLTAAFSPILRDFYDFAATLTAPPHVDWVTPAMSNSIMLFTGTMADSVRNVPRSTASTGSSPATSSSPTTRTGPGRTSTTSCSASRSSTTVRWWRSST